MQRSLFFLALIVVLAGCSDPVRPPVPDPPGAMAVTSVLRPGGGEQRLLLTRVRPVDEQASGNLDFVQGASVQIGDVPLENVPADSINRRGQWLDRTYNYATDSLQVRSGETYPLTIQKGDTTITGRATVPERVQVSSEGRRLEWPQSEGASLYRITVEGVSNELFYRVFTTADTALTIHDEDLNSGSYAVEMQVLGDNLAQFQTSWENEPGLRDPSQVQAGVEGAYGVFSAVTTVRDTVRLEVGS